MNTLTKCIHILTLFNEDNPVMTVSDIAARLCLPKSTVYRHVSALKQHDLIEEEAQAGHYRLGIKILELARSVSKKSLLDIAFPFMEHITKETGETVILSALRQHQGICLEKVEGRHALRVSHERGATFPLHAGASGKTLMAYLDEDEQGRILNQVKLVRFSETTITDPVQLRKELRKIRTQGYAESDGEVICGTVGIGAPILSPSGKVLAALSVSTPTHRLEGKKRERMIHLVVTAAREITEGLRAHDVQ
jgi:DNA-binding IclR family transcriptional regulator